MRGQALSSTRKLNKHWQSGEGGGPYVDPYTVNILIPASSDAGAVYGGYMYVPNLLNNQTGIISLYREDNPSCISSALIPGTQRFSTTLETNLAALPMHDGTEIFCSSIANVQLFNPVTQEYDRDAIRVDLRTNSQFYREKISPYEAWDYAWYPANIIARLRVYPTGDWNNMNFIRRENITLSNFYSSTNHYDTKVATFSASILTAKYIKISLSANDAHGVNSLIIPIPTNLTVAQEIISTSGLALPVGSHDVSTTHNPPIWRQESAFLRMALTDATHLSVTVYSVYGLITGMPESFDVSISIWEEDPTP